MKVGDLVMTVYRKEWAIVVRVQQGAWEQGAEFVYPDGTTGIQPRSRIKEVISASR
tara:strand:+ start:156 stop:323 length:168 start_codon:yes stop_codon:yes gene_type:complete